LPFPLTENISIKLELKERGVMDNRKKMGRVFINTPQSSEAVRSQASKQEVLTTYAAMSPGSQRGLGTFLELLHVFERVSVSSEVNRFFITW
jgi:hypothetical protein